MIVCHWPSRLMVFRPSVLPIKPICCASQGITARRKQQIRKGLILWRLPMIWGFPPATISQPEPTPRSRHALHRFWLPNDEEYDAMESGRKEAQKDQKFSFRP